MCIIILWVLSTFRATLSCMLRVRIVFMCAHGSMTIILIMYVYSYHTLYIYLSVGN